MAPPTTAAGQAEEEKHQREEIQVLYAASLHGRTDVIKVSVREGGEGGGEGGREGCDGEDNTRQYFCRNITLYPEGGRGVMERITQGSIFAET